ncbi:serine proteinase stubble [Frieseomelitta varia]|uniref:serine proteinase stubble n=1 Tax=Frieseomelitta varia TaxID=561572 RepID=UPI001CB67B23|nr:serine proteinase stubble [Frieseomelitta varia]
MWDRERKTWIVVLLANVLLNIVTASPIYVAQFIPGSTGRNIRHLPCVSRRTGETGVCMFAFTCAKANGTHLGTCIDRFYFGSCCKIDEEPDIFPQDNSIDDGSPGRPFVTTHGPIESNDIPEYFSRPKPINEKKPSETYSTEETTNAYTTQSIRTQATTVKETTKVATKKPVPTTSQRPTTLETATRPPTTTQTFIETTKFVSKKPIHSSTTHKPVHSTVQRPTNATTSTTTQSTTDRTTESTTSKTIITTTQRVTPVTRFPPRNATTARPLTHATTRKPTTSTKKPTISTTRRPTSTTKKPTTPSKRPSSSSTTVKPTTNISLTTLSLSTTTTKPLLTSIKHRPTIATTTENVPFSTETKPLTTTTESVTVQKFTTSVATTRPTQKVKPTTVRTTTTAKPLTTAPRPKPTKISSATTTPNPISKPEHATTTEKTGPLSSINVSTVAVTKPRPTVDSTKPTKPWSKPTSSKPTSTTPPTVLGSTVTNTSFASSSSIDTTTISTPAYVPTTKVSVVNQTTEETFQTTYSPGLVTWTSSSDDTTAKTPEMSSTVTTQPDQTESEWTPIITTPDGWIMIQSPTTKKPQTTEDTTDKLIPDSTSQSTTSAKPTTETSTEHVTKRPTILTTLSSIASVTIDTELPVPMETLNMSDYKQVCGRRLFPESRIVGGNRSSFGKWPWQISLRQWRTSTYLHKCGAALLNENWAITAAHCVENVPPSDLLLRIGEHDLANEDEPYGYQERRVQIVASHPQFDPRTFEYDLALLRFYEPLSPFQPNVLPICLPDDDETYVGRTAYVTGWGRLYDEGPLPSTLQEVAVPVINNTMCEIMYRNAGYIEHIPHIFICAGWRNGGFDSCEGDSGGPMVIQRARDKRWILAGVISWGIGCAVPNQPGVYTRISEFREWINQILQF